MESTCGVKQDGKTHGKGEFYLPDSSYLKCISDENQPSGNCILIKPNKDYYVGEMKDYQANGKGKLKEGETMYEGEFKNNIPHGKGK